MKKPLTPDVLVLIPDGIEAFVLSCTVCREPLPSSRRSHGHHAGACHRVVVLHSRHVIGSRRCIACLHPSTPEEREEFKRWRKDRGDRGERSGRRKGQRNRVKPGLRDGSDETEIPPLAGESASVRDDAASKSATADYRLAVDTCGGD